MHPQPLQKLTATPDGIMIGGSPLTKQAFDALPLPSKRYMLRAAELLQDVTKEDWDSRTSHDSNRIPTLSKAQMMMALAQPMTQEEFHKYNFNPHQPRVPAGNTGGGEWTADAGSTTTDANVDNGTAKLSAEQVGNIIFNETRSLSSLPGSDINDARANIAYMIRNGEDWAAENGIDRPITASTEVDLNNMASADKQLYQNIQNVAAQADISRGQDIDPANGAIYMLITNDRHVRYGTLTASTGPFHNSFTYGDVPYKTVYINFSK